LADPDDCHARGGLLEGSRAKGGFVLGAQLPFQYNHSHSYSHSVAMYCVTITFIHSANLLVAWLQ